MLQEKIAVVDAQALNLEEASTNIKRIVVKVDQLSVQVQQLTVQNAHLRGLLVENGVDIPAVLEAAFQSLT